MSTTIKVAIENNASGELTHRFQNFGEAVYSALDGLATVSLDEIDHSRDTFFVRDIRKSDLGSVTQLLRRLAANHFPEQSVSLVRVDRGDQSR